MWKKMAPSTRPNKNQTKEMESFDEDRGGGDGGGGVGGGCVRDY